MCGISGIVSLTERPVPVDAVVRMHRALLHRGPDDEGFLILPLTTTTPIFSERMEYDALNSVPAWAVIAHRRLSILDLSAKGRQPMCSSSGNWWIAFNGEIYNFLELKALLPQHLWKSDTDTEVLVELWERYGEQCLGWLIGMWAFVLVSPRNREIILCRDRFGIKPLYYAVTRDWLLFASEIRALFASGLLEKRFRPEAVRDYLAYGVTVSERELTFYEGVFKVQAASYLRWRDGNFYSQTYYSLPTRPSPLSHNSWRISVMFF